MQALPDPPRASAIAAVASLVAPGGTLLVISGARAEGEPADGPPWPLVRSEVEAFATGGVEVVAIEEVAAGPERPWSRAWRAELRRPR